MRSLKARHSPLSSSAEQLLQLNSYSEELTQLPRFERRLRESGLNPLRPKGFEVLQVNVGKMCNQTCRHCHVDAGPDRREIMTKETMLQCLRAWELGKFTTVDITGGAPEMNPDFRWFVSELSQRGAKVIVRCNLTIILANEKYRDLPLFFKQHRVHIVSSLPFYEAGRTDAQRGNGVFQDSIAALKMLNEIGYGRAGSGLELDLVYNPAGAFLPPSQERLEADFKVALSRDFGIEFNRLFTITNMPISRFLEFLIETDNLEEYMHRLVAAYNPVAAKSVMCLNTVSVGWDGQLYDCDFNQMLELPVLGTIRHIRDFSQDILNRDIAINQHCYGCTAGAGSSCGGSLA